METKQKTSGEMTAHAWAPSGSAGGRLLSRGLGAGVGAGLLDLALIAAVDPAATRWTLLQSLLAWAGTGWAVIASESGLGSLAHGVLATVLLNLGWFVALGPGAGTPEHVPPLAVMSVVFGAAFGWVHRRARRPAGSP